MCTSDGRAPTSAAGPSRCGCDPPGSHLGPGGRVQQGSEGWVHVGTPGGEPRLSLVALEEGLWSYVVANADGAFLHAHPSRRPELRLPSAEVRSPVPGGTQSARGARSRRDTSWRPDGAVVFAMLYGCTCSVNVLEVDLLRATRTPPRAQARRALRPPHPVPSIVWVLTVVA